MPLSASKKFKPKLFTEPLPSTLASKTTKPRQKGIAIPKININPIEEEDTPPQLQHPLLMPTFQGKNKSSLTKLKPVSVSSSAAPAPAPAPLQQQGEEPEELEE